MYLVRKVSSLNAISYNYTMKEACIKLAIVGDLAFDQTITSKDSRRVIAGKQLDLNSKSLHNF